MANRPAALPSTGGSDFAKTYRSVLWLAVYVVYMNSESHSEQMNTMDARPKNICANENPNPEISYRNEASVNGSPDKYEERTENATAHAIPPITTRPVRTLTHTARYPASTRHWTRSSEKRDIVRVIHRGNSPPRNSRTFRTIAWKGRDCMRAPPAL